MKKIKLSDGRSVQIGTQFGEEQPPTPKWLPSQVGPFRSVRLRVTVFDIKGKEIGGLTGIGYCNPGDQFCKSEGRKWAMRRLFADNRKKNLLTREDCHVVSPVLLLGRVPEKTEAK